MKTTQQSDKMLDAAARLFGSQRFHEVRMEDIAAEAGVGKGTLYRYFQDKEELYLALLGRCSTQFVERLESAVTRAAGARHKLEALVAALLDFFTEHPHLLDLIQRAEVMVGSGPEFPWQKTRQDLIRLVHELFECGRVENVFVIRDPDLSTLMLLGALRSLLRFSDRPLDRDVSRWVVETFLQGANAGIGPCSRGPQEN